MTETPRPPKPVKTRIQRRPLHGVLLLDKPIGLSSNDALQKAKWLLRAEKAGHTGTLDPLATGVLPLCFGAATKFSQLHLDANKCYRATLKLGQTTTTGDAEGELLSDEPVHVTLAQVQAALQCFLGDTLQTPPMYSALKHEGKPLYEYARAGIVIERPARPVRISAITLTACFNSSLKQNCPSVSDSIEFDAIIIEVSCSKGTYIRTLAEDIGKLLGVGAHLIALRRTSTGMFVESQCTSLEAFAQMGEAERLQKLLPVEELLHDAEKVVLSNDNAGRFLSGMRRATQLPNAPLVAVYGESPRALLGSAHIAGGELIPTRLLSPTEVSEVLLQQQT